MNRLARYSYLLILFAIIIIIAAAGYGFVQQQKQIVIDDTRHQLATIADLKASQIVAWRRERLIEATSLYSNAMMAQRIEEHLKEDQENKIREELHTWMKEFREAAGYNSLMLFRPDGTLITSSPQKTTLPTAHYLERVKTAVQTQALSISDLHYEDSTDIIDFDMTIPIMHRENGHSRCIAVLLIDIDPQKYLYPLVRTWPSPSFSGETLLVKREGNQVLYLNSLRFKSDAALRYRVPLDRLEMPAVRAALVQEGVFDGVDYRGVHVYAALRTIPDSSWAIVAKIDRQEMLEPVSKRIWYVVGTCLLFVFATGMTLFLWWKRKREAYLHRLYEAGQDFNRELKQAELSLQDANNRLEERVALRTEELSSINTRLKQEILERKQVEELLRKYFLVIEQSPVAVIITDLAGTIEFVNPKFTTTCGYTYEDAIGQNPRILKTDITPPEVHKKLWAAISAGNTWQGEFCNRKKNSELYWEYAKIFPIKDRDGVITNYMAFKEDITKRKRLEEKLRQSRKLEIIGQIAGGVAHEVRNPLNAILSITEALFREKEIDSNPEYAPFIQHIRTQVTRLANLMNDLLDLGKTISPANLQSLPLRELCRETMELWKSSGLADNRQGLITSGEEVSELLVMGDYCKLQQIFFNLLENAGYNTPSESKIILHLAGTVPGRGMAVVRIIDTGRGIAEENIARIFEPFYSDRRGGTGLGLSLVKHFIENMGGSVRIWNNDPPPGCTAEILIPIAVKELT